MIKSYFKIAWRNLSKHKVFSMINIFGLAIGIASFWVIALYVTDELSYDHFNTKADRIFRVTQHGTWNGGKFDLAITSAPYAAALKNDFPEVENTVRINEDASGRISYGDKQLNTEGVVFADNSIFDVFTYHFLSGDPKTALLKPQSIVLTKSLAIRIFGNVEDALNKTIYFENNYPNLVSGVIDDVPANSHLTFTALRSFTAGYTESWGSADLYTYVLLKNHDDYRKIEARTPEFYNKYLKKDMANVHFKMELQPLTDIHLHSKLDYDTTNGSITYVYIFTVIGLLILAIAIINYVNLATARSSIRVKEIGVRKVIGSGRGQLMLLFFAESILLAALATGMAVVLVQLVLPFFNQLSGKSLVLMQFGTWQTVSLFTAFAIITGALSGIYPALFLSGFKTIPAMKGQMGNQASTVLFRKSLVVFQFVITMVMITGSCVIYSQLHYVLNKDLGFNKDQVLTFHIHNKATRAKVDAIKQQLVQNPLIQSAGVAGNPIGNNDLGTRDFNVDVNGNSGPDTKLVQNLQVDEDFIPTMQIKVAQGRNFDPNIATDKTDAIIINETLAKEMGWKNPVGKRVRTDVNNGVVISKTIVGVIKDFNTYSLQHKISPMVLTQPVETKDADNLYVRINKNNVKGALQAITEVYNTFDSDKPEFHFLDQNFARNYQSEQKQGSLLLIFTVLAISIACLGLFGLVTFTAQQRNKEIGIRKILGASVTNIVNMLSKDLIKLVIIAAVIASPLAWWAMQTWLQGFAYRIHIQLWMFAMASGVAILIAFATISFQSVRSALANPVKSLRNE
ncbi:ABC transporter permease [Mucilaginibacter jinjuensis]|uniref:ABC transporter permease n=1 Tax=Mucilaginibacter jinjuensis TaxID=1176721 RepID=A0ABY7TE21_9SPHI|nr:ABC transporter permease [Mucilaginibacter jinjuensis]WCT13872.1 ABC transporter permease [Mucilaginibacter jinjuensis]